MFARGFWACPTPVRTEEIDLPRQFDVTRHLVSLRRQVPRYEMAESTDLPLLPACEHATHKGRYGSLNTGVSWGRKRDNQTVVCQFRGNLASFPESFRLRVRMPLDDFWNSSPLRSETGIRGRRTTEP
jgi:hypothetical protein